jgi:low affinity Fe/Cu permease
LIAGALVVLSLLFAVSGHWVLTIITAVAATVAVWVLLQARAVR